MTTTPGQRSDLPPPSDEEVRWVEVAAEEEDSGGGFPGSTGALTRRARAASLERVPGEFKDWAAIEAAIRPEVQKVFIKRLRQEISSNMLPSAMSTAWRAVIDDLRRKVTRFGLQHFSALEGMPALRGPEELETHVTEHRLLAGCQQLGLLDEEAFVHLNYCLQLISGFVASARFTSTVDRLDVLAFIKNCIKYCLAVDSPAPGFDLKALVAAVDSGDLSPRIVEFEEAIASQPKATAATVVRLVFRRFVEPRLDPVSEANILRLFPVAWKHADDKGREAVAQEFVTIRLTGASDQAARAWNLLLFVEGAQYLPDSVLERYFAKASQELLDAYNSFNNFHNEGEPARALRALGPRVPETARDSYVKAVAQSILGNPYGESNAARPHVEAMLDRFDSQLASRLLALLDGDADLRSTMMSKRPAERLSMLIDRISSRIVSARDRQLAEKYRSMSALEIKNYFWERASA